MAKSERFLFETSFDTDQMGMAGSAEAEAEPVYGEAELEQARAAAYAEGEAAGRQDAVNSIEKQLLNGLGRLVEQMGALTDDQASFQDGVTERSVELALKAIRKLFPTLAERGGLDEIEALLADCLREAKAEPRVIVRTADALVEPLTERIDALAAKAGHEGRIVVLAEDSLAASDCRVEWAEGGAERVVARMWQEFEDATQRIFKSPGDELDSEPPEPAQHAPQPALAQTDAELECEAEPRNEPEPPDPTGDDAMAANGLAGGVAAAGIDQGAVRPGPPGAEAEPAAAVTTHPPAEPAAAPDADPAHDPVTAS